MVITDYFYYLNGVQSYLRKRLNDPNLTKAETNMILDYKGYDRNKYDQDAKYLKETIHKYADTPEKIEELKYVVDRMRHNDTQSIIDEFNRHRGYKASDDPYLNDDDYEEIYKDIKEKNKKYIEDYLERQAEKERLNPEEDMQRVSDKLLSDDDVFYSN